LGFLDIHQHIQCHKNLFQLVAPFWTYNQFVVSGAVPNTGFNQYKIICLVFTGIQTHIVSYIASSWHFIGIWIFPGTSGTPLFHWRKTGIGCHSGWWRFPANIGCPGKTNRILCRIFSLKRLPSSSLPSFCQLYPIPGNIIIIIILHKTFLLR